MLLVRVTRLLWILGGERVTSWVTCKWFIVGVTENARADGDREHDLYHIELARVNPADHIVVVFEK